MTIQDREYIVDQYSKYFYP